MRWLPKRYRSHTEKHTTYATPWIRPHPIYWSKTTTTRIWVGGFTKSAHNTARNRQPKCICITVYHPCEQTLLIKKTYLCRCAGKLSVIPRIQPRVELYFGHQSYFRKSQQYGALDSSKARRQITWQFVIVCLRMVVGTCGNQQLRNVGVSCVGCHVQWSPALYVMHVNQPGPPRDIQQDFNATEAVASNSFMQRRASLWHQHTRPLAQPQEELWGCHVPCRGSSYNKIYGYGHIAYNEW